MQFPEASIKMALLDPVASATKKSSSISDGSVAIIAFSYLSLAMTWHAVDIQGGTLAQRDSTTVSTDGAMCLEAHCLEARSVFVAAIALA